MKAVVGFCGAGFRLGFGVVSVLFGPSTREPVEVLADLGGAIDFNTKMRAGVPKNNILIVGTDKSCGPPPGALGPGGPGPGGPWPGGPLARGALGRGAWPGGPLARGALGPGALGLGGPWWGVEIRNQACLDPSPASWSRNPATRDQGAPGGGARQTLNPKP